MVFENPIFYVERLYYVAKTGGSVDEASVRKAGVLLGTPFKRLDVFFSRYNEVFTRFIEKRCAEAGGGARVCIYSWSRKRVFKSFPVSDYATGTVIMFVGDEPVEVMATPLPKALDYTGGPGPVPPETVPLHVSPRIDGWQVNLYYDRILDRWVFSTRYVLHNMYFSGGRLVIDRYGEVSNPIVSVADTIASETRLYEKVGVMRGWVFVFSLLGPEPLATSPPYPIGQDVSLFSLYLVAARTPEGSLVPGHRVCERIGWGLCERPIEARRLSDLYEEVRDSLYTRSYIAWVERGGGDPLLLELSSRYYQDAMMVKYMYDAKSAAVLCSEGLCREVSGLIEREEARRRVEEIGSLIERLTRWLEGAGDHERVAERVYETLKRLRGREVIEPGEVLSELRSGAYKRLVKKIVSVALENMSLVSGDVDEVLSGLRALAE